MDDLVPRAVPAKRDLSKGGIAGVVVGVCVGVALLLFCLYPVVIRRVIRRQRERRREKEQHDAENGQIPVPGGSSGTDDPQRRLSSQDSFKAGEDLSRGVIDGGSVKDLAWTPSDGLAHVDTQNRDDPPRSVPAGPDVQRARVAPIRTESQATALTSFTGYEEEFMPQSIGDAHDGTLNGTSADYYSPNVPSSAFGMDYDPNVEPEPEPEPKRSLSRGSSLRYNLKYMFSRKSTRDQSMTSPTSPTFGSLDVNTRDLPPLPDAPLQRITTADVTTESPTDMYPPASDMMPPEGSRSLGSPISLPAKSSESTPQTSVQTPPQSPPESKFRGSASPPTHPAPGTVNPMDIMPATTDTEVYYRTEQQLYMSYQQSSPTTEPPSEQPPPEVPTDSPSPFTLPPNLPRATPIIQTPTPTQEFVSFKRDPAEDHDIAMVDIPSHSHLTPVPDRDIRHPSYPSEVSTPLPGPASTNASTLNTPATQLDTPSPNSEATSSDYHHSVSPGNGIANLSPKNGSYPCDEPGCNQVFDQPHKLKHHQRYHTKEHKCTYPGCGKGFGTKTHLQRHINDRHEKKKKFHCAVQGCDYSRQGGKGFPRKDNWKRHMTKIHNMDQRFLPEPVEADQEMSNV